MKALTRFSAASCAVVAFVMWAPLVSAYEGFQDGCQSCHADLADRGPDHDEHALLSNDDCNSCHVNGGGPGFNNPPLANCVRCHGRDQDAGGDTESPGLGRGLRQHHTVSGFQTCTSCHSDGEGPAGVGENVLPSFYPFALNGAGLDSCDGSEERFESNTISLDNDGDGQTDSADPDCATANTPPVADAGPDQTVDVGVTVTLDGSGSSDADGDSLTYSWSLNTPAGSSASLSDPSVVSPTFVADVEGDYTASLVVNDGTEDSAADTVLITAQTVVVNTPPVANAGPDQTVDVGVTVTLDGSASSDADGDALNYSWSLATPGGGATLSDPNAINPTFIPDVEGIYTATLIVNDGMDDSTPDSAAITAQIVVVNTPPVANAGPDQTVTVGDTVLLDGSGSSDADGDPLTFSWSLTTVPAGSAAVLSDPIAATPTFVADVEGDYVVQLIVNDDTEDSPPDTAMITAQVVVVNTPPVANAGPDQNVSIGDTVVLDGSGSTDAEGDPLDYSWSLTSVPAGSAAAISDPTAASPTFLADVEGEYVAQLIVNDGEFDSAPDTVMITAQIVVVNTPPVADAGLDQSVLTGDTVILDGSGSSDADGDPLMFSWSLAVPAGSGASLSDTTVVNPSFVADVAGDYVAQLIVNDGMDDSAPDSAVIMVAPPLINQPPVANAGPNQSVPVSAIVTLDGNGSSDPEGDPLTYSWSLSSVPAGSTAALSDPAAVNPTFTADAAGDYVVQLIVNDGEFDSEPDTVMITAQAAGELVYNQNCAFCHGDPFAGPALDATLAGQRRVTGARECSIEASIFGNPAATNNGLRKKIRFPDGVPDMAFLQDLNPNEIQQIAAYLNSDPVSDSGERRYITACAGCHGDDASGGFVDKDLRGKRNINLNQRVMQYLLCLPSSDVAQMSDFLRNLHSDDDSDSDSDDDSDSDSDSDDDYDYDYDDDYDDADSAGSNGGGDATLSADSANEGDNNADSGAGATSLAFLWLLGFAAFLMRRRSTGVNTA